MFNKVCLSSRALIHLLHVLPVRRRDHLRGQARRRLHTFCELLIDQMKGKCKLLSGQFPDVSNVTEFPESTDSGRLRQSVMIYTLGCY